MISHSHVINNVIRRRPANADNATVFAWLFGENVIVLVKKAAILTV